MKEFAAKKGKGYIFSLAALLATILGLILFRMLISVSTEQSERPAVVVGLAFAAILFDLIATYRDYCKIPSLAAYAASTAMFFSLVEGRVSYLAFYFSGDVLNTGLSPYLVASLVLFLIAMVCSLFAVICRQEKEEADLTFRVQDLKVILPMLAVVAILCGVALANVNGNTTPDSPAAGTTNSPEAGSTQAPQNSDAPAANYKTPGKAEDYWQNYTPEDYVAEDLSGKAIAYQFSGHGEISAGEMRPFDAIVNLYEDGEAEICAYGMGRASHYYGYWTNEGDDHLWFCVTCYTMETVYGVCTIDYSYELTGHFDDIELNLAMGFANGGQFVRTMQIGGGDGSVKYASTEEYLQGLGWTPAPPADPPASEEPVETPDAGTPLFSFLSDSENYLLDFYPDGTYTFTFKTAGLVENGTWTWKDWTLTLTDFNGKETVADQDPNTHAMSMHYVSATSDQVSRDFTCEATVWGTALGTTGSYEPAPAAPAEPTVLFSFLSDSENYLLDFNTDGTYTFTFKTAGLVENGTWTWKDWTLTLTDFNGKETVAEQDPDTHAMSMHYVSATSELVSRDFTCEATVWGTALGTTGSYEP